MYEIMVFVNLLLALVQDFRTLDWVQIERELATLEFAK